MATPAARPLLLSEIEPRLGRYLRGGSKPVLLAVSGGPDSVALMRLAAALGELGPIAPVVVATVDHGLRKASRSEAAAVAAWAEDLGFTHRTLDWAGPKPVSGLQEAARAVRYALLRRLAAEMGAACLLTAHTADDQAETILMRLLRGSGADGLAGMRPETACGGLTLGRPFLDLPKARLVATCAAEGWPFIDDPSNRDPRFTRARLRALMPRLAAEGLTVDRLVRLGRRMRDLTEAVEAEAETAFAALLLSEGCDRLVLDARRLRERPVAVRVRVLARAIGKIVPGAGSPERVRLERLERAAAAVAAATAEGKAHAQTLAGARLIVDRAGRLVVGPEAPRRRGRPAATPPAPAPPYSLGKSGAGT